MKRTMFTLCVDDFGVKYFSLANAMHLINAVKAHYDLTIDWTGKLYCGLTLYCWHYSEGYVDISMPDYVTQALKNSTIQRHYAHSTRHANGSDQPTSHANHKAPPQNQKPNFSTSKAPPESKPSMAPSCIMAAHATQHSMKSQPNMPPPQPILL
jgi:hypothetical protein